MKKILSITSLLLIIFSTTVFSQWSQTNGIKGGYFTSIVSTGTGLIANTGNGRLFSYDGTSWSASLNGIHTTSLFDAGGGNLVGVSYGDLFVSTNKGASWETRTSPVSSNVEPLVKDGNIYFITSQSDSIYISTDLGVTWDGLLMGTTFLHNGETKDIFMASDFDVKGNRILLHAFTGMSPVSFILLESQDLGQTWSVSFIPQISEMIQKVGLEDNLAILCTYDSVYKKTEGGTWTSAVSGLPGLVTTNLVYLKLKFINGKFYTIVGGEVSGLFRFDGDSWVNMNATGYVTDFDFHNESLIASTSGKVIKLVENDWSSISDDLIATTTSPIPFNKDIVFSKSGTVLYRTTNGGTSWDSVVNSIGKISFRNNELFSWDHTGVISSTDFGSSWNQVGNSGIPASYLSKMCGIAPTSDIIYAIFSGTRRRDHLPAVWEQGGVYRSTNNGNSWQPVNSGITHEGGVPAPGYEIYASGTTVVFRSIEGLYSLNNSSWQKIVFNLPQPLYFSSIEVNNDSIVIGSNQGLLVSTDKGLSWLAINHGFEGPAFQSFYRKFFRYDDSHFAYDYSLNTMYKLSDTTWSLVEFGPPAELQVVSFAQADDQLYIGTIDRGIWKYIDNTTDVEGDKDLPTAFKLDQNFPNPFNPSTTIKFSLLKDGFTTLRIYNILGELKAELVNGDLTAGNHSINFDASKFGSGIYLYTLTSNGNSITKKMALLK